MQKQNLRTEQKHTPIKRNVLQHKNEHKKNYSQV